MSAAFVVPGAKTARDAGRRFSFRLPGESRNRTLPLIGDLRADHRDRLARIARAAADVPEGEPGAPMRARIALDESILISDILEAESPGVLERLHGDQLDALVAAWREASGVAPGESSAS